MRFYFLSICLLIFVCVGPTAAQLQPLPVLKDNSLNVQLAYSVGDIRGTVKRKALFLPKPVYPRAALDALADGAVKVEIAIDAEGAVVSARAVSGNPLLISDCEAVAMRSRFRRDESLAAGATEPGLLIYNFKIGSLTWFKIGFDLEAAQHSPTLTVFKLSWIERSFGADWQTERDLLGKLVEIQQTEIRNGNRLGRKPGLVVEERSDSTKTSSTITARIAIPPVTTPDVSRIGISQNLVANLRSRLSSDPAAQWSLEAGTQVARAIGLSYDEKDEAVAIVSEVLRNAPADTAPERIDALRRLSAAFAANRRTTDTYEEVRRCLIILFKQ